MIVDILEPEFAAWQTQLRESLRSRGRRGEIVGEALLRTIRAEVMEYAREYSRELEETALQSGVRLSENDGLPDDDRHGLVMAGHQPIVFHPGLMCKAESLTKLARDTGAFGVHVVIDTDAGKLCEVSWPRVSDDELIIRRAPIAREVGVVNATAAEETLYAAQRVATRAEIRDIFAEMRADLLSMGHVKEAERAREIGIIYERLEGSPIASANSIARCSIELRGYREVQLSSLLRDTSLRDVLPLLASDAERLHKTYNACLEEYRREHAIKNAANPFPNLRVSAGSHELPLWLIKDNQRHPLWSGARETQSLGEGSYIATRGSLTTMVLRAYCCDLFVHGLGGGKYDHFVNMFTARYLGVELPPFVVASRTRVLDEDRVEKLSAAITRGNSLKEIVAQTKRYLGTGIFTESEEERLRALISRRDQLRVKLAEASDSQQRSVVAHQLNDANREVREIAQTSSLGRDIKELKRNEQLLARWSFREFPYFLF